MGLVRNFFSIVLGVMLMTACSNSDSNDWESGDSNWDFEFLEDAESGYLDGFGQKIPIMLVSSSELPDWLRPSAESWGETEILLARVRVLQGKWDDETIYYINNDLSSCIGCQYYHHDGRQFDTEDWEKIDYSQDFFTDWRCIYSAAPLVRGIVGTLHYDSNEETRSHYVAGNHKRYYIWGSLNTTELQQYDGQIVVISGFSEGDITEVVDNCPSGTTCYGLEATYIDYYSK